MKFLTILSILASILSAHWGFAQNGKKDSGIVQRLSADASVDLRSENRAGGFPQMVSPSLSKPLAGPKLAPKLDPATESMNPIKGGELIAGFDDRQEEFRQAFEEIKNFVNTFNPRTIDRQLLGEGDANLLAEYLNIEVRLKDEIHQLQVNFDVRSELPQVTSNGGHSWIFVNLNTKVVDIRFRVLERLQFLNRNEAGFYKKLFSSSIIHELGHLVYDSVDEDKARAFVTLMQSVLRIKNSTELSSSLTAVNGRAYALLGSSNFDWAKFRAKFKVEMVSGNNISVRFIPTRQENKDVAMIFNMGHFFTKESNVTQDFNFRTLVASQDSVTLELNCLKKSLGLICKLPKSERACPNVRVKCINSMELTFSEDFKQVKVVDDFGFELIGWNPVSQNFSLSGAWGSRSVFVETKE